MALQYYIFHKPYGVLSQFTREAGHKSLHDYLEVPPDVYPVGRLDHDSEGLLLLTNDTGLNKKLLDPAFKHEREYWVQVDGDITQQAMEVLEQGVEIRLKDKTYHTLPARAYRMITPPDIPERIPPIRFRKEIPTSWIRLVLHEGKNRQVRRMTAAVGFPTLRLIRYRIEGIRLSGIAAGEYRTASRNYVYNQLFRR